MEVNPTHIKVCRNTEMPKQSWSNIWETINGNAYCTSVIVTYPCLLTLHYRPNNVKFVAAPTTALSTKWNLKEGDIVTFKHRGFWLGSQRPKSPIIYRLRPDKTWDDVVASLASNESPEGYYYC
jgi:hypothetical protein